MHVVVIGAYGSAGVAAADRLAGAVDRLTLVDDGDPGGGLCILRGCMPSKELLSAGEHRFLARHDERLSGLPEVDVERVIERKDEHTSNWAAHRRAAVEELADRDGVAFHHATARFVGERQVAVDGRVLDADAVVVATGSVPNVPDLAGLDSVPFHTSADVLDATAFPDSAVVMGFGYVGLELVPYLSEVGGVDCTVVEHDDRPLDEADPAFGDALLSLYREAFDVEVVTNAAERSVERTDDGVRLHLDTPDGERSVEAEALYAFTGRRPNLDGLDLAAAGIEPGEGWVDDTMRTRDDGEVYVVGDANGKEPILHVAKEQGHVAAENILSAGPPTVYENTHHHVVFSGLGAYPYARVGHSRASAAAAGHEVVHVERQASDDGVFKTKSVPFGRGSLVVATDGTVLGWQGLHHHADAMAKTMQVVIETGMDVRDVPDRAYHPTTPEILDGLVRAATAELAD